MWTLGVAAIINVTLNLIFIPRFSYMAAAYTSVITEFVVVVLTAYMAAKKLNYKPAMENFPGILSAGALMAVFLYVFKELNFFILAILSSAVYLVFLWIFKAVETSEITSLISKKGLQEYDELP